MNAMDEGDSEFAFLANSAWESAQSIRAFCDEMFARYPNRSDDRERDRHRHDFKQRFCSRKNPDHNSAFWELLLHEVLFRLGFEVEPHPLLDGTDDRPDFRIHAPGGDSLIVEAVCQMPQHETDQSAVRRLVDVRRALNKYTGFPQWNFIVGYIGFPVTQVSTRDLLRDLSAWLSEFEANGASDSNAEDEDDEKQTFVFEQDQWKLHITPIAASSSSNHRKVAAWGPHGTYSDNTVTRARDKVDRKAGKYGKPPLLIAANINDPFVEREDIESLLFGSITAHFCRSAAGIEWTEAYRGYDGLFMRNQQPTNQNVIGVLLSNCNPWNLQNRAISFHLNPFGPMANKAFDALLAPFNRLPCSSVDSERNTVHTEGDDLRAILELAPD